MYKVQMYRFEVDLEEEKRKLGLGLLTNHRLLLSNQEPDVSLKRKSEYIAHVFK